MQNLPVEYENPYKFNAKELDTETDLYYYGARYYNPRLSVWYGVDPLAEKAPGWTPYRYGFNNPIKYTDPKGLFETKFGAWWHRTWNGGGDSKIKYDNRKKEYYYNRGDDSKGNEVNFTAVYSNSKRSAGTPVFQVEAKATLGVQAGFRTPFGTAEAGIMTGDIGKVGWSSNGFYAKYGDGKGHNYAGIGVGIDAAKLSVGGKADYVINRWIPTAGDLFDYYPNNGDWDVEGNIGPKVNLGGIPNESLSPIIDSKIKQRLRGGTTEACSTCIDVTGAMKLILGVEGRIRVGFTGQDDY